MRGRLYHIEVLIFSEKAMLMDGFAYCNRSGRCWQFAEIYRARPNLPKTAEKPLALAMGPEGTPIGGQATAWDVDKTRFKI